MGRGQINEMRPPYWPRITEKGYEASRAFMIEAVSDTDALNILNAGTSTAGGQNIVGGGIGYGTTYTDAFNITPSLFCACKSIAFTGEPPARPLDGGGEGTNTGLYSIVCTYSTTLPTSNQQSVPGGPAVPRIETVLENLPFDIDFDGNPVQNVNEEPIDPPLQAAFAHECLVFEWRKYGANQIGASLPFRPFRNALNSVDFAGAPKGCVYCPSVEVTAESQNILHFVARLEVKLPRTPANITAFFKVLANGGTVAVAAPIPGWYEIRLHRGRRYHSSSSVTTGVASYNNIIGIDGNAVSEPVSLDSNGQEDSANKYGQVIIKPCAGFVDFHDMPIPGLTAFLA